MRSKENDKQTALLNLQYNLAACIEWSVVLFWLPHKM